MTESALLFVLFALSVHLTFSVHFFVPKDTSKLPANLSLFTFYLPSVKRYNHFLSKCNEIVKNLKNISIMVSSSYIVLYRPTSWFNRKTEKGKIVGKPILLIVLWQKRFFLGTTTWIKVNDQYWERVVYFCSQLWSGTGLAQSVKS